MLLERLRRCFLYLHNRTRLIVSSHVRLRNGIRVQRAHDFGDRCAAEYRLVLLYHAVILKNVINAKLTETTEKVSDSSLVCGDGNVTSSKATK